MWIGPERSLQREPNCLIWGGGERLLELKDDWPQTVVVTEEYQPNFELAKRRLGPLGVRVENVTLARKGQIPFADCSFDVVLNRHSGFNPGEVARILLPGGVFFTQQVHGLSLEDLMAEFGAKPNWPEAKPESYVPELESAGFSIITCEEYQGRLVFSDVGAIIYLLKAIPWLVNDFSVDRYAENLYRLQSRIEHKGELLFTERHYLIEAVKTS